jgi:Flavin containing amine oxidoreductase
MESCQASPSLVALWYFVSHSVLTKSCQSRTNKIFFFLTLPPVLSSHTRTKRKKHSKKSKNTKGVQGSIVVRTDHSFILSKLATSISTIIYTKRLFFFAGPFHVVHWKLKQYVSFLPLFFPSSKTRMKPLFLRWFAAVVLLYAATALLPGVSAESPLCSPGDESPDVLILGAGMAGLTAAKRFQDLGITYKIVESTHRVGGRVRSKTFGNYTIEEGANWVSSGNAAADLAVEYGIKLTLNRLENFAIYEYNNNNNNNGTRAAAKEIRPAYRRTRPKWRKAFECVLEKAEAAYLPGGGPDLSLDVLSVVLPQCGWKPDSAKKESLAFFFPWLYLNFNFANSKVPLADIGDSVTEDIYFVNDERGFDYIPRNFQAIHGIPVELGKRVTNIKYNVQDDGDGGVYPALVTTIDTTTNNCIEYRAKHILSTLPIGVYESGAVTYDPPLLHPNAPFKQQQYAKIFYQFKTKFWDDREFIVALRKRGNQGFCHHWQNLDYVMRPRQRTGRLGGNNNATLSREFYPGSKILFCTMTSEDMTALLGEGNVETTSLSDELHLRGVLLDPLRAVYGNDVVDANLEAVYDPQLNTNPDTGFGAYSAFIGDPGESGDVFTNMYNFFGGYNIPGIAVERCEHNGCAAIHGGGGGEEEEQQQRWVLHMSGTASCFNSNEFVYGAIYAGERSANYIAKELGYDGISTASPGCEDFYVDGETASTRFLRPRSLLSRPHWVHF